jgi:RNA polymerase sigma factor (sigma-70 family)
MRNPVLRRHRPPSAQAEPASERGTDAELMAQVASGQLEALGELFDRHEPEVRRYLHRLGASAGDIDDLVQVTFLEIVRAAARFDPQQSARAWLLGVATFMLRRQRRTLGRALARLTFWKSASTQDAPPSTPLELIEGEELTRRVERALARLSPKKREVFVLVTLEGLSGEETARTLDIPVSTVWTRLHHARRELRAALRERQP